MDSKTPQQTPNADRGTDSTNNIHQNEENFNPESQKGRKYALQEALQTLGDYDATRRRHIESNENDRVSRNYDEIVDFIKSATKKCLSAACIYRDDK